MKLGIAIPALNEEDNIESIIQRLSSQPGKRIYRITSLSVTDVEVTVASDGSTDRTVELASRYKDLIRLIVFSENQGYGAAIKEAWTESDADLLGFLDADGTCDPKFFAPLCNQLLDKKTDVALGCRLNNESEMPLIRRLGNSIFAFLLSIFASSRVQDTASGNAGGSPVESHSSVSVAQWPALHAGHERTRHDVGRHSDQRDRHAISRDG